MSINIDSNILASSGYTFNNEIIDPKIITDGLVLWLDPGNFYSYAGDNADYYLPLTGTGCEKFTTEPGQFPDFLSCADVALLDMSGNGNDFRRLQNVSMTYSESGAEINFPGVVGNYATMRRSPSESMACADEITIIAWVNHYGGVTHPNIIGNDQNTGWRCRITTGGQLWFYVSGNSIQSTATVSTYEWSFICFTGDANGLAAYLNNTLVASNGTAYNPTNNSGVLIGTYNSGSEFFKGQMGPIFVYERALSVTEMVQIYDVTSRRFSKGALPQPSPSPTPSITPTITPTPTRTPTPTPTRTVTPTPSVSPPSIIYASFGSTTVITSTSLHYNAYRLINHTPHSSPNVITMTFHYQLYAFATSSYFTGAIWYSKNSTSSWTLVDEVIASSFSKMNTKNGNFSVLLVDYNDVVRIRIDMQTGASGPTSGYGEVTTTGGSVTSGSGTVQTTSPTTWFAFL